jgi:hypothetical protein
MRELGAYPTTLASPAADRQGPALADRVAARHLVYLVLAVGSVEVNWAAGL